MRVPSTWISILKHEWWTFLLTLGVPVFVVLASLYAIGVPQDFEVWQYAPPAIPTLAIITSDTLHTNHLTLVLVWLIKHIFTQAQYVFIVLYVLATGMTALVTYVVARICMHARTWAMLLALMFTLAPARFWFVDISFHWWVAVPLVWLVVYQWWYRPMPSWRVMYRYTIPCIIIPWLGWEYLWWSSVALVLAAVIAAVIRTDWSWRYLAYTSIPIVGMTVLLQLVHPIAWPFTTGDGMRLLEFVVPHRTHLVPWFATLGERLHQLEIPQTSTVYAGILAICGSMIVAIRAVRQLVELRHGEAQSTFIWLFVLFLLSTINGWQQFFVWLGIAVPSPQLVQLFIVFGALWILVEWLRTHTAYMTHIIICVMLVMLIDQIPTTNLMRHMRESPRDIPTKRLTDGIWFGQSAFPSDVVSVLGLSTIEPGYGRWSDAALADRVQVRLRKPLTTSITIEIRARGVAANVGVPIPVRIGTDEQFMVLDTTVKSYLLTFPRPDGETIEIIPQPVATPPEGDVRRIGVFVQSIRVVNP